MRIGQGAATFVVVALLVVGSRVQPSHAAPSHVVQYQGRLTNLNGVPFDGTAYELRFKLFSADLPSEGSFVWGERHRDVKVQRGVFTVLLGAGTEEILYNDSGTGRVRSFTGEFDGDPRFIQVTVIRALGDEPEVLSSVNQVGSVPYAIQAGGSVPIGGVVDWYRPTPTTPVPPGWVICDGRPVNDPESPMNSCATPNLVGRFVRGLDPAAATGTAYGANLAPGGVALPDTGTGQLNLAHSHVVPGHSHGIDHTHGLGSHTHTMSHTHRVAGRTNTADQPQLPDVSASFNGGPWVHFHAFDVTSDQPSTSETGPAVGSTSPPSTSSSGPNHEFGTYSSQGVVTVVPPYVGLLKIMRVR